MGWYWLIRSYKFQVYNSIIHHLYIALCSPPKVKSPFITLYLIPFTLFYLPSPPSPLVTVILLSVFQFCLFVFLFLYLFICCFLLYIPDNWNHKVLGFFLFDLFCLVWYSQDPPMLYKWQYFSFSYLWVVHSSYEAHRYPIIHQRILGLFPCVSHCE